MSQTTTEFLRGLKRRITMPANQVLLDDEDILAIGSDILHLKMTKILKAARQNYLLVFKDIPFVADQSHYDVPYRAVVGGLEDVKYLLSDGITLRDLTYITVEELYRYGNTATYPEAFYFQSDQVAFAPTPAAASGGFRAWYHRQLSSLCPVADAGRVTDIAIGVTNTVVTVDNAPAEFVSGAIIDFVKNRSLTTILYEDATITNVAGTQLTFVNAEVPSRLIVGDWVSMAQTIPVLPLPDEAYDYFEGLVGVDCLAAIGDNEGSKELQKEVDDAEKDIKSLLEPRIDGQPEKIVNYHGLLRQMGNRRRFGGYGS